MPKARKDPNKPKGVKSAYIYFVEQQRADRERQGKQLPFAELSKKCGGLWGDMDEGEKSRYVQLSEQDKIRHEKEMCKYVPPQVDSDCESEDDGGHKKKKKKVKDPNAPKRPISAYFFFAAAKRPEIKADNPGLGITQMAAQIGEMWRGLEDDDKKPFEKKAAEDKARYLKAQKEYQQTLC